MAKNPVCPIYYNDLLNSTKDWNDEEFGAYCRLLFHQWDKGSIPEEMARLIRIAESAKKNWKLLSSKFLKTEEGLKNPVMENHRETREKFTKRQQENVLKRYQSTYQNSTKLPTKQPSKISTKQVYKSLPLENENENENLKEGVGENFGLWVEIKKEFFNAEGWQYRFCTEKKIDKQSLIKKMREFITDLDLKEDFKDLKELKNHFTNWFNQRKKIDPEPQNSIPHNLKSLN